MTEYGQDARLTYSEYLHVPQILREQVCLSEPPAHDELQFIVVHQVYELWFKLVLFELDEVRRRIDAGSDLDLRTAARLCRRVETIFKVLVQQIHVLETMRPVDFLAFRTRLKPASGFQSVQYRELEFLSGLKDETFLARFRSISAAQRARLERRLSEPSLWDAFVGLLASRGLPAGTDEQILDSLRVVAGDRAAHDEEWQLAEDLLTHDELAALWRARHVVMVERQIGTKSGTGGSTGAPYLRKRIPLRYFPLLWELRDHL